MLYQSSRVSWSSPAVQLSKGYLNLIRKQILYAASTMEHLHAFLESLCWSRLPHPPSIRRSVDRLLNGGHGRLRIGPNMLFSGTHGLSHTCHRLSSGCGVHVVHIVILTGRPNRLCSLWVDISTYFSSMTTLDVIIEITCDDSQPLHHFSPCSQAFHQAPNGQTHPQNPRTQRRRKHTEEAILPIPLPPRPDFKLLTKNQKRMTRNLSPMMRLPFPLHPDDPNINRMDTGRDICEKQQDTVDPEIDSEAFAEVDCHGR